MLLYSFILNIILRDLLSGKSLDKYDSYSRIIWVDGLRNLSENGREDQFSV